jgi:hypothetical protein
MNSHPETESGRGFGKLAHALCGALAASSSARIATQALAGKRNTVNLLT